MTEGKVKRNGQPSKQGEGGGRPKVWTTERIEALIPLMLTWIRQPNNFWLGKWAAENGLWRQRLEDFAAASEKFSDALKVAKAEQEYKLVVLGVKTKGAMPIFCLKNVSDMRDNLELTHAGEVGVRVEDPWKELRRNLSRFGLTVVTNGNGNGKGNGNGNGKKAAE